MKKPKDLDRDSAEYQEFLRGMTILGRTAKDMGELTGKPEDILESMADGLVKSKNFGMEEASMFIMLLLWELAHRDG